jgi:hypothetical protein
MLVRCADVNRPGPLADCGSDPLAAGYGYINYEGEVEAAIYRAVPNVIYQVYYRSLDGSVERMLGEMRTNAEGYAYFEKHDLLEPGDAGAGNLVLEREDLDQFVSGFKIIGATTTDTRPVFYSGLIPCKAINVVPSVPTCGDDPIAEGRVVISKKGDVTIAVARALRNSVYEIHLLSTDGTTTMRIGILRTGTRGDGGITIRNFFRLNDVGAGNVVFKRAGLLQFVTGFKVAQL